MKKQSFLVVRFKDRVLVPTQSKMEGSAYLATEPVTVHPISDEAGLAQTIIEAIRLGNPIVPHPSREAWPKSVLLKPAGVKSQVALERFGVSWFVACNGTNWHIYASHRNEKDRWEADPAKAEVHPANISPEQLAQRMVELVKNADIPTE
jgi:hypothetical protein